MLLEFLGMSVLARLAMMLGLLAVGLLMPVVPLIWNYFRAYREYGGDCDKDDVVFTNYPDERWLEIVAPEIFDKLKNSRGTYMLTQDDLDILHAEISVHGHGSHFALHENDQGFRLTVNGKEICTIKNVYKNNWRRLSQHQPSLKKLRTGRDDQCKAVFFDVGLLTSSMMYAYNKNHFKGVAERPMDLSNSEPDTFRQKSSHAILAQGVETPRRRNNYLISEVSSVVSQLGESSRNKEVNQRNRKFYVVSKVQPVMTPPKDRRDDSVVNLSLGPNNLGSVDKAAYVVGGAIDYPEHDSVVYVASLQPTG